MLLIGISTLLWVLAPTVTWSNLTATPLYELGQLSGLVAITLLSWNFILATRNSLLERVIGGLDRVYQEHKVVGLGAFVLMLLHPFLFIAASLLQTQSVLRLVPFNFATQLGTAALWMFIVLIILTIAVRWIPYHIWKWTHKLMGIPFILASIHAFFSGSTIAASPLLRWWLGGLLTLGTLAYFYKVLLYRWLAPHAEYQIKNIDENQGIIAITLDPIDKPLDYHAGQFVFVRFHDDVVSSESHPYSIASDPSETELRLAIKKLGDHTAQLPSLNTHSTATVYGPHGRFGKEALSSEKDMIWIAGGIGVTPFLSLAPALVGQRHGPARDIACYYCTSTEDEAIFHDELATHLDDKFLYENIVSKRDGRISAKDVADQVENISDRLILLCGPQRMMEDLAQQFVALGVPRKNIKYESFALR